MIFESIDSCHWLYSCWKTVIVFWRLFDRINITNQWKHFYVPKSIWGTKKKLENFSKKQISGFANLCQFFSTCIEVNGYFWQYDPWDTLYCYPPHHNLIKHYIIKSAKYTIHKFNETNRSTDNHNKTNLSNKFRII